MRANPNRFSLDVAVAAEVRAEIARHPEISVSSLAVACGMRRATLSVRTNGHVPFSPADLDAIASALGTTASALVMRAERARAEQHTAHPAVA